MPQDTGVAAERMLRGYFTPNIRSVPTTTITTNTISPKRAPALGGVPGGGVRPISEGLSGMAECSEGCWWRATPQPVASGNLLPEPLTAGIGSPTTLPRSAQM